MPASKPASLHLGRFEQFELNRFADLHLIVVSESYA